MAATVHPHRPNPSPRPHLRLATSPAMGPEPLADAPRPPVLRPIDGGRSRTSLRTRRMFWRRRLIVALGLMTAVVVSWQIALGVTELFADPAPDVVPALAPTPPSVRESTYVVQPGDTLWSIAQRVAPGRDPRPLVDELSHRTGDEPLRAGQRIDVRGLAS